MDRKWGTPRIQQEHNEYIRTQVNMFLFAVPIIVPCITVQARKLEYDRPPSPNHRREETSI